MLTFITILAGLLSLSIFGNSASNVPAADAAVETITMTAKKYEFSPSVVTVAKGQHVKLEVTALDRDHGLEIKDYNVNTDLKKGVPATIEFVADREGEFTFKCSDYCGLGHGKMKGKLVVTATE
jgi:cytochrome c oxidase subunit 2